MYHANGKSQRKGIPSLCSPEYGMFSAYPHLPDVLDAKHEGITIYMHWSWLCGFGLVFCVGVFFGGVWLILICLGFSAVHLCRAVSVSSLRTPKASRHGHG